MKKVIWRRPVFCRFVRETPGRRKGRVNARSLVGREIVGWEVDTENETEIVTRVFSVIVSDLLVANDGFGEWSRCPIYRDRPVDPRTLAAPEGPPTSAVLVQVETERRRDFAEYWHTWRQRIYRHLDTEAPPGVEVSPNPASSLQKPPRRWWQVFG